MREFCREIDVAACANRPDRSKPKRWRKLKKIDIEARADGDPQRLVVAADLTEANGSRSARPLKAMIVRRARGASRSAPTKATMRSRSWPICGRSTRPSNRTEPERAAFRDRWPHHPARGLRGEPAEAKAHRRAVQLGQDDRRSGATDAARGKRPYLSYLTLDPAFAQYLQSYRR
jgi:hypothetical protein